MKKSILLLLLSAFYLSLTAQEPYIGLFHSEDISQPEFHADGIFQYFIESDNQVRNGNTEEAILLLDNAIAMHPFFPEAYIKRATLLMRTGRQREARRDLEQAHRLNPNALTVFSPLNKDGRIQLLAFYPETAPLLLQEEIRATLSQSITHKREGNINSALQLLQDVIQTVDTPSAFLYNMRGNLYLLQENYNLAVADYNRALQLTSEQAPHFYNRGMARLFTYNRAAACDDLKQSAALGYERGKEKYIQFCKY